MQKATLVPVSTTQSWLSSLGTEEVFWEHDRLDHSCEQVVYELLDLFPELISDEGCLVASPRGEEVAGAVAAGRVGTVIGSSRDLAVIIANRTALGLDWSDAERQVAEEFESMF